MYIPPGIFLILAALALVASPLVSAWIYYAGRTGKNPVPTITLTRRSAPAETPTAPNGRHTSRT
jgi:hypothetical protein